MINYRGNFGSADNPVGQITYAGAPSVLTMQVGGNNCGFAGVVESCLVQPYPLTDYGAAYPDPTGSCAQGLANVTDVIEGRFYGEFTSTVNEVLNFESKHCKILKSVAL